MKVYLANLANTAFGYSPATVPLEIGYLKAYADSCLQDEVEICLFRTFESLLKAVLECPPTLIGCSWYAWNRCLTISALEYVKSKFPSILSVVGGANVPTNKERCFRSLIENPCIDFLVPLEGEIPFVNLLSSLLEDRGVKNKGIPIDGILYLSKSNKLIAGQSVKRVDNLNILPSPYLRGDLDEFLADGMLLPVLQMTRGCPYSCSFCVSGGYAEKQVRGFDLERVFAELDYLETNARNRSIRVSDENFGMLSRDLPIAEYIADKRKTSGYPAAVRLFTNKNVNERMKSILLTLKDFIPVNIALQSLTDNVLEIVGRKNVNLSEIEKAVDWAHGENLLVTTEIIFGLPEESYVSFMAIIDKIVTLRFDSVSCGPLMMLKETEIASQHSIDKYNYRIMYSLAERGFTRVDSFQNIEVDAWGVENKSFTYDDYIRVRKFMLLFDLLLFHGYLKEMLYVIDTRGIGISRVIMEIIENIQEYPFIGGKLAVIEKSCNECLFDTEEEARASCCLENLNKEEYYDVYASKTFFIIPVILKGELIHSENQGKMLDELAKSALKVFRNSEVKCFDDFSKEMQFAKDCAKMAIIPYWEMPEENVSFVSQYDLLAWRRNSYRGVLSEYILQKPIELCFQVRIMQEYNEFIYNYGDMHFSKQSEYFFRTVRTNNIRRFLA